MTELTLQDKKALIQREIKQYNADKFTLQARIRVMEALDDNERIEQITKDLERIEKAIMVYEKQIEELE